MPPINSTVTRKSNKRRLRLKSKRKRTLLLNKPWHQLLNHSTKNKLNKTLPKDSRALNKEDHRLPAQEVEEEEPEVAVKEDHRLPEEVEEEEVVTIEVEEEEEEVEEEETVEVEEISEEAEVDQEADQDLMPMETQLLPKLVEIDQEEIETQDKKEPNTTDTIKKTLPVEPEEREIRVANSLKDKVKIGNTKRRDKKPPPPLTSQPKRPRRKRRNQKKRKLK